MKFVTYSNLFTLETGVSIYNEDNTINSDYVLWLEHRLETIEVQNAAQNNTRPEHPNHEDILNYLKNKFPRQDGSLDQAKGLLKIGTELKWYDGVDLLKPCFNSQHPKHETVEEWENRTGKVYPDDGPVWMSTSYQKSMGGGLFYELVTKKRAYDKSKFSSVWSDDEIKAFYKKNPVYIANEHGKPEE